ncbi:YjbF family lipoprotein [Gammaproteobacteria bacterium]|nr:YjbF family lipoprotein [Gammaproteobacteria bacterium]MDC1361036.1 YjbF family lipoprotein [Gammaproteobacteria bacterium]
MIRLLFAILFLTSCGNLPITYLQNFSSVNSVVFGFPEYEITEEVFNEYDNSFIKVRFGRGPHAILVLAYVENNVYEWVGADNVQIFTLNGRIIKTAGLTNNFEILRPSNDIYSSTEVYETINLYNPDLISSTIHRAMNTREATIKKLGRKIKVNRIEESFDLDLIGWTGVNLYYRNTSSNQIESSEQRIHPRLPIAKIEYYFKY